MQLSNRRLISEKINSVIITEAIVKRQKCWCVAVTKDRYSLFCLPALCSDIKQKWSYVIFPYILFSIWFFIASIMSELQEFSWDLGQPKTLFILSLDATVMHSAVNSSEDPWRKIWNGYRVGLFVSLFYCIHLKRRFVLCVECLAWAVYQKRAAWWLPYFSLVALL